MNPICVKKVKTDSSLGPKAEPKPKPKTSPKPAPKGKVMAAVAIVAALSSMAMPAEGCLELAAGTGAGRHLVSSRILERQGIHHDVFDRFMVPSSESLRFTTVGGWKLEFGCRYKGVFRLVGCNAFKHGNISRSGS